MQITQNGIIRVYKSHVQSISNPKNPLLALPISVIDTVKKVNLKYPVCLSKISVEKKENLAQLGKNQFMLLYKKEAIDLIMHETDKILKHESKRRQSVELFSEEDTESTDCTYRQKSAFCETNRPIRMTEGRGASKLTLPPP